MLIGYLLKCYCSQCTSDERAKMFKVNKAITPIPGEPIPNVDVSIVDDEAGIILRETSRGKEFSFIFRYEDGRSTFSFGAQVIDDGNKYWMVRLGFCLEKAFQARISIDEAIFLAKNIKKALSVYAYCKDGPVADVRFEMMEWSKWGRSNAPILMGDEL